MQYNNNYKETTVSEIQNTQNNMDKALARITSMEPYHCNPFDNPPELRRRAERLLKEIESLNEDEVAKKEKIMEELFGTYNKLAFPGLGFKCDFGLNIHFHGLAVINYNVVMLDTSPINIGHGAFIGPGVCLTCAGHAIHPSQRSNVLTSAPITLEEDVWLGANVTVLGGVTIGKGSVIGAGSVVTKDIPAGVIAVGNPCKVKRKITDKDMFDDIQI